MIGMPRPPMSSWAAGRSSASKLPQSHTSIEIAVLVDLDDQQDAVARVLAAGGAVQHGVRHRLAGGKHQIPGRLAVEPMLGGGVTHDRASHAARFQAPREAMTPAS